MLSKNGEKTQDGSVSSDSSLSHRTYDENTAFGSPWHGASPSAWHFSAGDWIWAWPPPTPSLPQFHPALASCHCLSEMCCSYTNKYYFLLLDIFQCTVLEAKWPLTTRRGARPQKTPHVQYSSWERAPEELAMKLTSVPIVLDGSSPVMIHIYLQVHLAACY